MSQLFQGPQLDQLCLPCNWPCGTHHCAALQLPIIIHGSNVVPDTHLILKYLARTYGTAVEQVVAPGKQQRRLLLWRSLPVAAESSQALLQSLL